MLCSFRGGGEQLQKMRKYVPEKFKDILCPKPYENEAVGDY